MSAWKRSWRAPTSLPSACRLFNGCFLTWQEVPDTLKSQNRHFTGNKARIAVDAASQLIVEAEVLAGDAADAQAAVAQVERVAERCGGVAEVVGDCAFAAGPVRAAFQEAGHPLRARQPRAG